MELNHAKEIADGHKARSDLQLVGPAMDKLRAAAIERIINSDPTDQLNRERMIVTCQILDAVRAELERLVDAGNAASLLALLAD